MFYIIPSLDLVVWELAGRDDQYDEADTGLPRHPDIVRASESRRDWKPAMKEWVGQRQVLRKVIESIVDLGRPA